MSTNAADLISSLQQRGLVWQAQQTPSTVRDSFEPRRHSVQGDSVPFGCTEIDEALPAGGLACGAIHEWFYEEKALPHGTLPSFFVRQILGSSRSSPSTVFIWIGRFAWPSPYFLDQLTTLYQQGRWRSHLDRCLFLDPPNRELHLWALEAALRSESTALVVAGCPSISLQTTQRLGLAAKSGGALGLLLRSNRDRASPSAAMTRWSVRPTPSQREFPAWELTLERCRGRAASSNSWIVSLEAHEHEAPPPTISLHVLSDLVDGSRAANCVQQRARA